MSIEATIMPPAEGEEKKPATFAGEPWAQQPGETKEAFEAFVFYRDFGPKRSNAKVASKLSKSKTLMDRWSGRWQWVRRSELYDQELDRQHQLDLREQRREMAKRQAKTGLDLQGLAVRLLKKKFGDDFSKLNQKSMKDGDVIRLMMEATKLERTALGEPDSIQEQQVTAGTADNDRKPFVPLTYAGRIDEALALLETARARAANGVNGEPN